MGTRADFYIGRGLDAEWLGSIAWDGYPEGIPAPVFSATTESEFRSRVAEFAAAREDWTSPDKGWPWPWDDSGTTDYAYAFDGGHVHAACFGGRWCTPETVSDDETEGKECVFPNMSARKNVTFGRRSGVMIIGLGDIS